MKHNNSKTNMTASYVRFALRITLATLLLVFSMMFYVSSIANAAILNQDVTIVDEHIRLGDIFSGVDANRNASYILGPAPKPGDNLILNNSTLVKLSRAFKLNWAPESDFQQVVISRAATIVSSDDIHEAINKALHQEGFKENYEVVVHNIINDIVLPGYEDVAINVEDLKVDTGSKTFRANVVIPVTHGNDNRIRVIGSLEYMVDVPVVISRLKKGDIIREHDIEYVQIPESKVTSDMIMDQKDLVGTTPRRVLAPQQVVKLSDVELPTLVERGSRVTMILNSGTMKLTAAGKALEDGAAGDVIRVVNLSSKRTIDGFVAPNGTVEVHP